ncbi:MAG: methyltransferase domain-containing protein [Gemmatimonadota bacterium]|nr:methyltransferase domain-containing protein [Gemmatimonadota bacterium]
MTAGPDWDASAYHRVSDPQFGWGMAVLDQLQLDGRERVLDIGCGSGRLTAELRTRLGSGSVVALDASSSMVGAARELLAARFPDRWDVVLASGDRLPFPASFDIVFSTATFHWIPDHPRLFREILRVLRPRGCLHAQCGGSHNLSGLHARATALSRSPRYARHFTEWRDPWEFASAETTSARLEEAGFEDIETSIHPAPLILESAQAYRLFLRTVVIRPYLAYLPSESLAEAYLGDLTAAAAGDEPPYSLDYWRLNLAGRRPAGC